MWMRKGVMDVQRRYGIYKTLVWTSMLAAMPLAGCATGAGSVAMTPPAVEAFECASLDTLREEVALDSVGGGEKTQGWNKSKVSSESLEEALRATLADRKFLSDVPADANFRLDAFLVELNQPAAGFEMQVVSFIRYKLTAADAEEPVYDNVVKAAYSMDTGDEFFGAKRLRLVNEGSVRTNIAAFVNDLCSAETADRLATR